ncbi:MAG: cytochrome c oxidase subunit 3 [Bacteroidota bacterium]|nr:cytochrome c oxidase subunit 3 [Bacteroidota bacterium]
MQQFDSNKQKEKVYSSLVLVGVIGSIMLFAGLSSAVLVRKMDKFWVNIHLPNEFIFSTIIILVSSITFYLALKSGRKGQKKKLIQLLVVTFLLSLAFTFFQFKGWSSYYKSGNAIKSFVTFVYGQYGKDFKVMKGADIVDYDGENYVVGNQIIDNVELEKIKSFLGQVCGNSTSYREAKFNLENYDNPFSIQDVSTKQKLQSKDGTLFLDNVPLSEERKNELFKFSFGVYNDQPFFMLKGEYGKDFSISLNGEDLIYSKKKLYFPEKELNSDERNAINKKVYQSGKEYIIKSGEVFLDGKEVNDFESNFQLDQNIDIEVKNGVWKQTKQELNANQYAEFYQTSNVSSSFVWVLTIIHFLHLILSLSTMAVVINRANKGLYNAENVAGLRAVSVFWHFVGFLWLYLYVFLEYIN